MSVRTGSGSESASDDGVDAKTQAILDQIEDAKSERIKGNELFKQGNIKGALLAYHTVLLKIKGLDLQRFSKQRTLDAPPPKAESATITELKDDEPEPGPAPKDEEEEAPTSSARYTHVNEVDEDVKNVIMLTYSNMAACQAKNENWRKCLAYALDALKIDEKNRKAKYREAQARAGLGEIDKARSILLALDKEEPDNSFRQLLTKLKKDEAAREKKSAAGMRGFLAKGAGKIADVAPVDHNPDAYDEAARLAALKDDFVRAHSP